MVTGSERNTIECKIYQDILFSALNVTTTKQDIIQEQLLMEKEGQKLSITQPLKKL